MNNKIEYRAAGWEAGDGEKISGYALVFEQRTVLYKDPVTGYEYGEILDRHALDSADLSDVVLRYEHQGRVLARTRNNSLRLSVDDHGLAIEADMSGSDEARSFYEEVKNKLIDKMSFGFTVAEDSFDDVTRTRRILKIERVLDVSLVSFPAYSQTEVNARSRYMALAEPERAAYCQRVTEVRSHRSYVEQRNELLGLRGKSADYATHEQQEKELRSYAHLPVHMRPRIDKREPIFRRMMEIQEAFETQAKDDLARAQELRKDFSTMEANLAALNDERRQMLQGFESAYRSGKTKPLYEGNGQVMTRKDETMSYSETREFYNKLIEDRAAATTATMTAVIPTTILDTYVQEKAPGAFLEDATITNIPHAGTLVLPIASLQTVEQHPENQLLETNGFVPGKVQIDHEEYAYVTGYSDRGFRLSAANMENIVNTTLLSSMFKKMDGICMGAVNGLSYENGTNAVQIVSGSVPSLNDFVKLAGMLGSDFMERAKWYMNAATFFSWLLALKDDNSRPIFDASKLVAEQAPLGYPIRIDNQIPANVVYFGAGSAVHLNYAREPEINMWRDYDHNMQKFSVNAVAGAAAEPGSFVKMYTA